MKDEEKRQMSDKKISSTNNPQARILMVLPTLGQRIELLKKTLESIKCQAPVKYDIVMVFPFENTKTAQLAKEYGAIMVDDPGGISAAVNAGIAQASSHHKYIGWIGDDDLIAPDSLKTAIEALDNASEAVVAFGYCDYIDHAGRRITTSRAGRLAPWLMSWGPNLVPCPGAVFRLSALRQVGEFDTNLKYAMDLDMFLRLRKVGAFVNTKRVQASFRWHPDSTTVAGRAKSLKESEAVKRRHLPKALRPFTPLWDIPVRFATIQAARRVNAIADAK